jgi:quercetin dioxygenase-like cupin family protein
MFFGPADLSSSAGHRGQWEGPGVADQILQAKDTIRRSGRQCGLLATSVENIRERQDQGFRAIGLGMDSGLLIRSIRTSLASIGRDRTIQASFVPSAIPVVAAPLSRPPERMRPDRNEVMNPVGSGPRAEIARSVSFECLVGRHNDARNLTTGIVTFAAGSILPDHKHGFTESITLLRGSMIIEVEGRSYSLKKMDNVVIPAGLAHSARNSSVTEPAVLNIAMATDAPSRTLVDKFFPRRPMPDDSTGVPGAERVNRFATAKRFVAGPNTEFIDFFNQDLMPGIEMSGGYGLFLPGGRLPAHVHDFDESICIISGTATCVVEGRRYLMSDCSTALQPRGRVHYFINESNSTMEMIWVYAGPRPERIIVDEKCATVEGNPWR